MVHVDTPRFAYDARHEPVALVSSGECVTFQTLDARCGRMQSADDAVTSAPDFSEPFPKVDPATGPVGIREAKPGDLLKVTIKDMSLASHGFVIVKPDMGIVRDLVGSPVGRVLEISDGQVTFSDHLRLPVRPMVGIMATAPRGAAVPTMHVHRCGGNMDNNRVRVGATVYLPVEVPLGLLYVGDVHAAMGDGEVCGLGIETRAAVVVRIEVIRDRATTCPMVTDAEVLATTGFGETFYGAARLALEQMIDYLSSRLDISKTEAYMIASCWGDLRPNQTCDGPPIDLSVRLEVPRAALGFMRDSGI